MGGISSVGYFAVLDSDQRETASFVFFFEYIEEENLFRRSWLMQLNFKLI